MFLGKLFWYERCHWYSRLLPRQAMVTAQMQVPRVTWPQTRHPTPLARAKTLGDVAALLADAKPVPRTDTKPVSRNATNVVSGANVAAASNTSSQPVCVDVAMPKKRKISGSYETDADALRSAVGADSLWGGVGCVTAGVGWGV